MEEKRSKIQASANRNKPHQSKAPLHSKTHAPKEKLDPELDALFERVKYLRQDLESKLQDFYHKTGLKDSDIKDFLADPSNFSPSEWALVTKYKELLYTQFSSQTGLKIPEKKVAIAAEKEGLSKARKAKSIGSRKKWIPMK